MNDLISLVSSPSISPILIVVALLLIERVWQIPERLQPLLFIRLLGVRLVAKKNKKADTSEFQEQLSGTLSLLLLTLPWLIILYFMNQFAYYPVFFDACLLLLSIQFTHNIKRYRRIQIALTKSKKQLAKDLLAKMVLRDTHSLSEIGISKGASEALVLRFYYQQISVIFWFVLVGPFFALFYRMLLELNYAWNQKLLNNKHFGLPVSIACHYIQWLPIRLAAGLAIITCRGIEPIKHFKLSRFLQSFFSNNGKLILHTQSIACKLHLSGTVMYEGHKLRREKFKGVREPDARDMPIMLSSINRVLISNVAVLLVLSSLLHIALANY